MALVAWTMADSLIGRIVSGPLELRDNPHPAGYDDGPVAAGGRVGGVRSPRGWRFLSPQARRGILPWRTPAI